MFQQEYSYNKFGVSFFFFLKTVKFVIIVNLNKELPDCKELLWKL